MRPDRRDQIASSLKRGSEIVAPRRCALSSCRRILRGPAPSTPRIEDGYCDESCFNAERQEISQASLRKALLERDGGVCALCGLDCLELRRQIDELREAATAQTSVSAHLEANRRLRARIQGQIVYGFDRHALESGASLWEADHEEPRALGGATTAANGRTLCGPCHAKATAGLARSRRRRR